MLDQLLLLAGFLLVAGLSASLLAGRLRVPSLVVFLLLGMLAGPHGLQIIAEPNVELVHDVGLVALIFILFEGGLASGVGELRQVLRPAVALSTLGVILTAAVVGVLSYLLLDLSFQEGLLLGAIVASTDGAAIFALLRGSTLRRRLARTLEGEAGMNDPVTALLVVGLIALQQDPDYTVWQLLLDMVMKLSVDTVVGIGVGLVAARVLSRTKLASEGLYPVASLAAAFLAYAIAYSIDESGLLAVYIAGLILGSQSMGGKRTILAFHDGLAWVAQLAMFLALGLLVSPGELADVWVEGIVVTVALLFVGRPVAVWLLLRWQKFSNAELAALSWAGLRGAVPIVFATFPVLAGLEHSREILAIVFFVVLLSTVIQGVSFEPFAARVGVTTTVPSLRKPLVEVATVRALGAEVVEVKARAGDALIGVQIKDLGLPRQALVNIIVRGDEAILPRGSSRVEEGDILHVLARHEVAKQIPRLAETWRHGPIELPSRPARRYISIAPIFRTGPWDPKDGDPDSPASVAGVPVAETLLSRRDRPGALVVLDDGRFGLSGKVMVVGSRRAVQRQSVALLRATTDESEIAWFQEVIGACSA